MSWCICHSSSWALNSLRLISYLSAFIFSLWIFIDESSLITHCILREQPSIFWVIKLYTCIFSWQSLDTDWQILTCHAAGSINKLFLGAIAIMQQEISFCLIICQCLPKLNAVSMISKFSKFSLAIRFYDFLSQYIYYWNVMHQSIYCILLFCFQ